MSQTSEPLEPTFPHKNPLWVTYYTAQIVGYCTKYSNDDNTTENLLMALLDDFSHRASSFLFPESFLVYWISALNALDTLMSKVIASNSIQEKISLLLSIMKFEQYLLETISPSHIVYSSIDRIIEIIKSPVASTDLCNTSLWVVIAATANKKRAQIVPHCKDLLLLLETMALPFPADSLPSDTQMLILTAILQLKGDKKAKKFLNTFPPSFESRLLASANTNKTALSLLNATVKVKGKLPFNSPILTLPFLQLLSVDLSLSYLFLSTLTLYPSGTKKLLDEGLVRSALDIIEADQALTGSKAMLLAILLKLLKKSPDYFFSSFNECGGLARIIPLISKENGSTLKLLLKLVLSLIQRFPTREGINAFPEGPLPALLSEIICNAAKAPQYKYPINSALQETDIVVSEFLISNGLLALEIFTTWIHAEPTSLSIFQEYKITNKILDSILISNSKISARLIEALPAVLTVFSLNQEGLSLIENQYIEFIEKRLSEAIVPDRSVPILIDPDATGEALDELARHQPTLRRVIVNALIAAIKRISTLIGASETCCPVPRCQYPRKTALSERDLNPSICLKSSEADLEKGGYEHEHISGGWSEAVESISIIIELFITTKSHHDIFCEELDGISTLMQFIFNEQLMPLGHGLDFDFCIGAEAYSFSFLLRHFSNSSPKKFTESFFPRIKHIIQNSLSTFESSLETSSETFRAMTLLSVAFRSICDLWISDRNKLSTLHPTILEDTLLFFREFHPSILAFIPILAKMHWDVRKKTPSTLSEKKNSNVFLFLSSQLIAMSVVALSIYSRLLLENSEDQENASMLLECIRNYLTLNEDNSPFSLYRLSLVLRVARTVIVDDALMMKSFTSYSISIVMPRLITCIRSLISQLKDPKAVFSPQAALSGAHDNDSIWKGMDESQLLGRTFMDSLELLAGILLIASTSNINLCIESLVEELLSIFTSIPEGAQLLVIQLLKFTTSEFTKRCWDRYLLSSLKQSCSDFVLKAAISQLMDDENMTLGAFLSLIGFQRFELTKGYDTMLLPVIYFGLQIMGHNQSFNEDIFSDLETILIDNLVADKANIKDVTWLLAIYEWLIVENRLHSLQKIQLFREFGITESLLIFAEKVTFTKADEPLIYQILRIFSLIKMPSSLLHRLTSLLMRILWILNPTFSLDREAGVSSGKRPQILALSKTIPGSGIQPLIICIFRSIIEDKYSLGPILALQNIHEMAIVERDPFFISSSPVDSKEFKLIVEPPDVVAGLSSVLRDPAQFFSQFENIQIEKIYNEKQNEKSKLIIDGAQLCEAKLKLLTGEHDCSVSSLIVEEFLSDPACSSWKITSTLSILSELFLSYPASIISSHINTLASVLISKIKQHDKTDHGLAMAIKLFSSHTDVNKSGDILEGLLECGWITFFFAVLLASPLTSISNDDPGTNILRLFSAEHPLSILLIAILGRAIVLAPRLTIGPYSVDSIVLPDTISDILLKRLSLPVDSSSSIGSTLLASLSSTLHDTKDINAANIIINTLTRVARYVHSNDDSVDAEATKNYQKVHLSPEDDTEWTDSDSSIATSESTDFELSENEEIDEIIDDDGSFDELDAFESHHHDSMLIDDENDDDDLDHEDDDNDESSLSMEEEDDDDDEIIHHNAPLTRSTGLIERRIDTSVSSTSSEDDQGNLNDSNDEEMVYPHSMDENLDSEDTDHTDTHHINSNGEDDEEMEEDNHPDTLTSVDPFEQIFSFSEDIIIRSSFSHILFSSFDDDDGYHTTSQEDMVFPRRRIQREDRNTEDSHLHIHDDEELVFHEDPQDALQDDLEEEHELDFIHHHHLHNNPQEPLRSPISALHSMIFRESKNHHHPSSPLLSSPSFLFLMAVRDKAAQQIMGKKSPQKQKSVSIPTSSLIPSKIIRHMPSEVDPGPISWILGTCYSSSSADPILQSAAAMAMLQICSTTARARQLGVMLDAPHDFLQPNTGKLLRKGPFNANDHENQDMIKKRLWSILVNTTKTIVECVQRVFTSNAAPTPMAPSSEDISQEPAVSQVSVDVVPEENAWMSVDETESSASSSSSDENTSQDLSPSSEDTSQNNSTFETESTDDQSEQWPVLHVTPQLDTGVLEALPEDMQREILTSYFYERRQNNPGALRLEISPEFLESIENPAIRALILEVEQEERQEHLREWRRQQRDISSVSTPLASPTTSIPPTLQEALGSLFAAAGLFGGGIAASFSRGHRDEVYNNEEEEERDDDENDEPDIIIDTDDEMIVDQEDANTLQMVLPTSTLRRGRRQVAAPTPFFVTHRFSASHRRRPSYALFPNANQVNNDEVDSPKPDCPSISEKIISDVLGSLLRFPTLYRLHRTFLSTAIKKNAIALTLASILDHLQQKDDENLTKDQNLISTLEWLLNRSSSSAEESFYKRLRVGDTVASTVNRALCQKDVAVSKMLLKGFRLLTELQRLGWCMLSPEIMSSLIPLFLSEDRPESIMQSFFTFLLQFHAHHIDDGDGKSWDENDKELCIIAYRQCINELDKLLNLAENNLQISNRLLAAARVLRAIILGKDELDELDLLFEKTSYCKLWLLVHAQLDEKIDPASPLAVILQALFILASITPRPLPIELPENENNLIGFATQHRRSINTLVRAKPSLLISGDNKRLAPLDFIAKAPPTSIREILDFENKRMFLARSLPRNQGSVLSLRIRREYVFEDSFREIMSLPGSSFASRRLSITFEGEAGVDVGGLTREWFSVLAKQMLNANYALFLPAGSDSDSVAFFPNRLSAVNPEHLFYFEFVGRIIGKALFEGILLDCHFSSAFYKIILGDDTKLTIEDLTAVDPAYGRSLAWIAEHSESLDDLSLVMATELDDFGRSKMIDLIPNGSNIPVTEEHLHDFISLTVEMRLHKALTSQFDAICKGLFSVVPRDLLRIFTHNELELIISGLPLIDDIEDWRSNTEYAPPYTNSSPQIIWFWRAVRSMTPQERAQLLQFVTGSSKVPLGGFAALLGSNGAIQRFSIHRDTAGSHRLPQAHTCFNQLDMPEYDSYEQLRERLMTAIREGTIGFGFA